MKDIQIKIQIIDRFFLTETSTLLIQLVLILFSARLIGEVAAYFEVPAVLGEVAAGLLLGPSLLGFIEMNNLIQLLAQVGIILILFEVGIETDIAYLSSAGLKALIVAVCGVIFPFILGFLLSRFLFDFSLLPSLFIACTLTATSIGITLRVLQNLKKQNSHEAQIIVGAAIIDDIIGIILLAIIYSFSESGEINLWNALKILSFIVLFFFTAPFLAKIASLIIKKWDQKSDIPGLLPTTIVSLILLFAWSAHELGAPELLGGFAAGLALSRKFFFPFSTCSKEFSCRIDEKMKPITHLFAPIFFVGIGLSLNLKNVDWTSALIWKLSGSLIVAAIVGKLFSAFFLKNEKWILRLIIGTAMIPRGEMGLVFATVGLSAGILTHDVYTAIILVILFTTLIASISLKRIYLHIESRSS